jgi:hypothetical protein
MTGNLKDDTMQKSISVTVIILFIGIAFHCAPAPRGGTLSVNKMKLNMGVVYGGTIKEDTLLLKNTGSDTLKIRNVKASCGCTTVTPTKYFLLPGESEPLAISFNSTGFRGPSTKFVYIETSDAKSPLTTVTLEALVQYELLLTNHYGVVNFGTVRAGRTAKDTLNFKNISNHSIAITGVSGLPLEPELRAHIMKKELKPGESGNIILVAAPKKAGSTNLKILKIETDSKNQKEVPVTVVYTPK